MTLEENLRSLVSSWRALADSWDAAEHSYHHISAVASANARRSASELESMLAGDLQGLAAPAARCDKFLHEMGVALLALSKKKNPQPPQSPA